MINLENFKKKKRNRSKPILLELVIVVYLSINLLLISNDGSILCSEDDTFNNNVTSHQGVTTTSEESDNFSNLEENIDNSINENCDTIHLAVVCGGFNSTQNFYVLLKSILFYRSDITINLHLLVDNISRTILEELFRTWSVPSLQVDFYNVTEYEHEISWIPSRHYSHRFGLMKLVFPSVLAEKRALNQIVLLDTDMLALGDLKHLWTEFKNFQTGKNIFGMVENQSDWYLGDSRISGTSSVWPALGRGFNSGLILVNLNELKSQNWNSTWRQVAETELMASLSTPLADQDIFNAVIRLHPNIVYNLPCYLNLQLNDKTKINDICPNSMKTNNNNLKIIHWNSPNKFLTKNPEAKFYHDWYITFKNWDGKLLEHDVCNHLNKQNSTKIVNSITKIDIACKYLKPKLEDKLRTHLYALEFELEQTDFDVTFVVHLSLDRLQVLDQLASHWAGPISAAIYLSENEVELFFASVENGNNLLGRKNIGYHLVFRDYGFNYPINRLRNIALNNSLTPYVFLSDIDFLPSLDLYNYLKFTIAELSKRYNNTSDPLAQRALVVPAFENLQYKFDFPTSKAELLTQLNLGSVSMFREQLWPRGHSPTNYGKWKVSTLPYVVDWRPDYEPFIVTSRNVSRFDERFVGFGWNKVQHTLLLASQDYEFIVLPEAFVIHKFHSASFDIVQHRNNLNYRQCIKQLKRQFLSELQEKAAEFFNKFKRKEGRLTTTG